MSLVLAAVAPHGDLAVPELCGERTRSLAVATQEAMAALGAIARQSAPEVVVIVSPHHLHLERSFGVVTSGRICGELTASEPGVGPGEGGQARIELDCAVDLRSRAS